MEQKINKKISEVLDIPLLHTYNYQHKYRVEYIKKLIKFTNYNFDKVYLLSGGSETTEAALKLMRIFGKENKLKPIIISLKGNWHGRTMGSEHMAGNESGKDWIGYRDKYIYHLDFQYSENLKKNKLSEKQFFLHSLKKIKHLNFKKDISGLILEAFQGWGAIMYPKDYVKEVSKIL